MGRQVTVRLARWAALVGLGAALAGPARAAPDLTREAIEGAVFAQRQNGGGRDGGVQEAGASKPRKAAGPDPLLLKVQILLDRAGFSPGAIDGRDGDNLRGALAAFAAAGGSREAKGSPGAKALDRTLFDRLAATSGDPVLTAYTITEADVEGPFAPIPKRLETQAAPRPMGYVSAREMLAERFHMQRALLVALNPDKPLDRAGTEILVAAVAPTGSGTVEAAPLAPEVARVEVDKRARRVRAFAADGRLVASYPASIGSREKPAPTGRFTVRSATFDPWYTYDPKYRFKGVGARRKFSIRPGPNNPVGLVWIDLSIPSYGIHGTPEPENVGKTESHGCIRLTNWDARHLASHVAKGAKAEFLKR